MGCGVVDVGSVVVDVGGVVVYYVQRFSACVGCKVWVV